MALTSKQQAVLAFLQEREAAGLPAPTVREIGERIGVSSCNGVRQQLLALEREGYVTVGQNKARFVRLVKDEYGLELERLGKCWRTLPAYLRKELLRVAEHYQEAVTVHEEIR